MIEKTPKQPNTADEKNGFDVRDALQIADEVADEILSSHDEVPSTPESRQAERERNLALLIHQAIKAGEITGDDANVYKIPGAKDQTEPALPDDLSINYSDQYINW